MKGVWLSIIFLCMFSPGYSLKEEKRQIYSDSKSLVENMHLDNHSKSLYQIYSQIISLIKDLNQNGLSIESTALKKTDISSLLKKAAEIEPNQKINTYLISLSEDIGDNDFISSYSKWLELESVKIDFIFRFYKKLKKYDAFVILIHSNYTKTANKYLSLAEKIKTNTISKFSPFLAPFEIRDQFVVADLLNATESNRLLVLHPPVVTELSASTRKIIFFRNTSRNFFDRNIKPISNSVFDVSLNRNVHFKPYFTHLILHQIAHYLGPYFVQSKSEKPDLVSKKIKTLFTCIEEIKSDSVAICAVPLLKDNKISSFPSEKRIYTTYVAYLIEKISSKYDDGIKKPFLIELNFLFKNEGLIYNLDTDTILIDFEKLKKAVNKMMGIVINIEQNGRYSNARQFIEEYDGLTPELKRIIKKNEDISKQSVFQ